MDLPALQLKFRMNRCAALLPAILASAIAACAFETPVGEPTIDLEAAQARATQIGARPTDRAGVRQLLGDPWLASDALGVDVYRLQGKQRNALVIFAPYPVPVPSLSNELEAYTLVTYGADGQVTAVASGFAQGEAGLAGSVVIRAGDFEFTHTARDQLSMSVDGYRRASVAQATGSTCTVLVTCDPARLAEVAGSGFCACAAGLAVDDGQRTRLWLLNPAIMPSPQLSESGCLALGGTYLGDDAPRPGTCVVNRQNLYPMTLPAGRHVLHFPTGLSRKGPVAELDCEAGEVSHATLGGEFMLCSLFARPVRDDRAVGATVSLSPSLPAGPGEVRVIVYDDGQWLLPPTPVAH